MHIPFQRVTFDQNNNELFIRGKVTVTDENTVTFCPGDSFSTDTLFNGLSIGKWRLYTGMDSLFLRMKVKGEFALTVYHSFLSETETDHDIMTRVICRHLINTFEYKEVSLPVFENSVNDEYMTGIIFFRVDNVVSNSCIKDIYYLTKICERINTVKLALNICTYNRWAQLFSNVAMLQRQLLDDENMGSIAQNVEIFITDNASNIAKDSFNDTRIHISHSKNLGGAGGFTKGLIDIIDSDAGFTHTIFMDDDANIRVESIRRTFYLLAMLLPQYKKCFIAGAMNMADKPYIQHENGALWNRGKCIYIGRGMDMRDVKNLLINEAYYRRDYAAWWYCCVPLETVSDNGFPAPFFIHGDDIEYSLRNANEILTMNGLAVCHPVALHRRVSANEYYNLRNKLVINAIYCRDYGLGRMIKDVIGSLTVALMRHRYKDMQLIKMAVSDYLKGPDFFINTDMDIQNKKVRDMGYSFCDVTPMLSKASAVISTDNGVNFKTRFRSASIKERLKFIFQLAALNGWFLPGKKETMACFMNVHPIDCYRVKTVILYDDTDNMGMVLTKRKCEIFHLAIIAVELVFMMLIKNRSVRKKYQADFSEMTGREFWEEVLQR